NNTVEGRQSITGIPLSVPVHIVNGHGADAIVAFKLADRMWTALNGTITFAFGGGSVSVKIPAIPNPITFTCTPTNTNAYLQTTAQGTTTLTAAPTSSSSSTSSTVASQAVSDTSGTIPTTGGGPAVVLQILIGLLLLDIGYLVLSLRRKPKPRLAKRG